MGRLGKQPALVIELQEQKNLWLSSRPVRRLNELIQLLTVNQLWTTCLLEREFPNGMEGRLTSLLLMNP